MAEKHVLLREQRMYIPVIAIERATLKHSWNRIAVALASEPGRVCGEARRIGYTGRGEQDFALYRLKIKPGGGLPTTTLPGMYIIDAGVFQDYEAWKARREET